MSRYYGIKVLRYLYLDIVARASRGNGMIVLLTRHYPAFYKNQPGENLAPFFRFSSLFSFKLVLIGERGGAL